MKRTLRFALAAILLGCNGEAPAPKLRVATDATFPPFELVDEQTKELTGFDVELITELAKRARIEIALSNVAFDPLLAGISQCQYDVAISSITITDERKQSMLFTDPYFAAGQIVVVRKGNSEIHGRDSLRGKTVGAQIGTTGAIEVGKIPGATLRAYDTFDLAFQDLINGQIDAVIADDVLARGYVSRNIGTLETVGPVFTSEAYGIAVCNREPDLVAKLDEALAEVRSDGTMDELVRKWTSSARPR